jgi:hypothetical protein
VFFSVYFHCLSHLTRSVLYLGSLSHRHTSSPLSKTHKASFSQKPLMTKIRIRCPHCRHWLHQPQPQHIRLSSSFLPGVHQRFFFQQINFQTTNIFLFPYPHLTSALHLSPSQEHARTTFPLSLPQASPSASDLLLVPR